MSALLGIHSLSKSYGTKTLFDNISFTISTGDRIGFIGPNGSGKSTLLKILMDQESSDSGSISRRQNLRVGYAGQSPQFKDEPLESVMLSNALPGDPHERLTQARILLGKAQFSDFLQSALNLSGGWKKRLDIAQALMQEPDLLLLDEPTNHLDLEGILWLEKFLNREKTAFIAVSHDRYFLENISNKIVELNVCYPQGLFVSQGNMSAFMELKDAFLKGQKEQQAGLESTLRGELEWLKRSPKARTTKSRSRIQRAYEMMGELSLLERRNKVSQVDLEFLASERETRRLLVAKNLAKSLGEKNLFKNVDLVLSPGSRLGIVGRNGTGKTTLLKVLAGQIPQDSGTLKYADDLKIVYFDQMREKIPMDISLKEALSPNSEQVNYRGKSIHVNGWAKRFLFSQDRLTMPVKCLSGGERARILIAKLMLEPADVLFLDEPTNDLDIPTLEVIEESLKEFAGAVVLISHDRCLMDRICKQILGLGEGNENQFFADMEQWESSLEKRPFLKEEKPKVKEPILPPVKKLSYKEQKELEGMELSILNCEKEIEGLRKELEDPSLHSNAGKSLEVYRNLAKAEEKLTELFERWEVLSSFA